MNAVPTACKGIDIAYGDTRGDRAMLSHATQAYYRDFTTPQAELPFWRRHKGVVFWTVMAILVLYQMLGVFFGMDVADAGFYLTFYDNIFSHPASVQYNFMYYLSGVIGGTLQSVCPGMGMLGMRLAGVTFNSLAGIVLYLALRNHVDERAIALGCALVVVSFIAPPYTLSYDLCTILFYVVTIALLWRGIMTDNIFLFSLAGFVAGLNVLVRIPNVLGLSLALLPVIIVAYNQLRYGHDSEWRLAILHAVTFLLGSALAISLVLLLMPAEHYVAFMQVLDDLQSMATDTSGTASHTTGQMIMTQLRFYATEAWTAVKLAVPVAAYWWAGRKTVNKWLAVAVKVAAVGLMVWFVARMHPLQPLWVMCVAGCVAVMLRSDSPWLRWIALSALGIMLIMPLGSDGAYNNGSIIAWAAAPVAALWWAGRNRAALPLTLLAVCAVRMVVGGASFDGGSLLDKQFTVHNARAAPRHQASRKTRHNTHGLWQHSRPQLPHPHSSLHRLLVGGATQCRQAPAEAGTRRPGRRASASPAPEVQHHRHAVEQAQHRLSYRLRGAECLSRQSQTGGAQPIPARPPLHRHLPRHALCALPSRRPSSFIILNSSF